MKPGLVSNQMFRLSTLLVAPHMSTFKAKCTKHSLKTKKCIIIGYEPGTKAYQLWDPQARKVIVSRDVIFDGRPKPLALPAPSVDLSQILYNGELPGDDTLGITQVGDAWDKPDMEPLSTAPMPSIPNPTLELDDDPLADPFIPVEPPHDHPHDHPAPPHRQRCTEIELLGDPPIIDGPCIHRPPQRYGQEPLPPVPEVPDVPPAEDPDADEEALAETAFAFAFSSTNFTSYMKLTVLHEVLDNPDAQRWKQANILHSLATLLKFHLHHLDDDTATLWKGKDHETNFVGTATMPRWQPGEELTSTLISTNPFITIKWNQYRQSWSHPLTRNIPPKRIANLQLFLKKNAIQNLVGTINFQPSLMKNVICSNHLAVITHCHGLCLHISYSRNNSDHLSKAIPRGHCHGSHLHVFHHYHSFHYPNLRKISHQAWKSTIWSIRSIAYSITKI